jgi:hypothetical protein
MLYLIADYLGFPGLLNLIRYISFRAGAATATALAIGLLIGPWFINYLRVRQGQGPADPRRRARRPPGQARHADHGRAADPGLRYYIVPVVDGPAEPPRLGVPAGYRRVRRDRLHGRLRQGQESAPCRHPGKVRLLLEF